MHVLKLRAMHLVGSCWKEIKLAIRLSGSRWEEINLASVLHVLELFAMHLAKKPLGERLC
jgi:hypothetical protein